MWCNYTTCFFDSVKVEHLKYLSSEKREGGRVAVAANVVVVAIKRFRIGLLMAGDMGVGARDTPNPEKGKKFPDDIHEIRLHIAVTDTQINKMVMAKTILSEFWA